NMCEVQTATDITNCGGCDNACALANAVPSCAAGRCQVRQCATGFGDCDANPATGCEANLNTSNTHCGRCNAPCAAGQFCVTGTCLTACPMSLTACGASCVNTTTDVAHCGRCNNPCPAPPNAAAACRASACTFDCAAGYADCNAT